MTGQRTHKNVEKRKLLWYDIILEAVGKHGQNSLRKEKRMIAFIGEFFTELIDFVILAAVGDLAIFCGKKLRDRKDAKSAAEISDEQQ